MTNMSDFYQFIKTIRKSKGWSQEKMAKKLDISFSTYSKIERGIISPNVERINQIFMVFGFPNLNYGIYDTIYELLKYDTEELNKEPQDPLNIFCFVTRKEFEYLKLQVQELKEIIQNSGTIQ